MKLDRLPEYFLTIIVTTLGIGFAVFCGRLTGTGQTNTLMMVFGAVGAIAAGVILKTRIWWLIFVGSALAPLASLLPGRLPLDEMCIVLVFGWFLAFRAVKISRDKASYGLLDLVLFVNLAFVAIGFVRNPTGVLMLESDRIGGRPYFDTLIAVMSYWVLGQVELKPKETRLLIWIPLAGTAFSAFVGRFGGAISGAAQDPASGGDDVSGGRQSYMASLGQKSTEALYAYFRPITLINPLYLGRFLMLAVGFYCILISGFRNVVVSSAFCFLLGSYYRHRIRDVLISACYGIPILIMLLGMQGGIIELPMAAQRALSFLPANWSYAAVADAEYSTEWRLYMWKAMLTDDKYLKNRWMGDGFGYSITRQMELAMALQAHDPYAEREHFLISGDVHSGPLSTLRYVGYIGLFLFIIFLGFAAVAAHKVIRRSYGTPYFVVAFFLLNKIIILPFFFIFVYGHYKFDLPGLISGIGILKLIRNGLDAYQRELAEAEAAQPENQLDISGRPLLLTR